MAKMTSHRMLPFLLEALVLVDGLPNQELVGEFVHFSPPKERPTPMGIVKLRFRQLTSPKTDPDNHLTNRNEVLPT